MLMGTAELTIAGRKVPVPSLEIEAARGAITSDGTAIVGAIDAYCARRLELARGTVHAMNEQLRAHIRYCRVPLLRSLLLVWRAVESEDRQPSGFIDELSRSVSYFAGIYMEPNGTPLSSNREELTKTHREAEKRGVDIFGGEVV